jgi:sugar phosphate isomerase/epimerase
MRRLGYCTNVHAGETLEQTRANLAAHAVAVRGLVCPDSTLGVGLWLSARAARALRDEGGEAAFGDWLSERGLSVFTINGFPYGDFHKPVVKHEVYQPTWADPRRLDYTLDLAHVLSVLVPEGEEGSISTLPIGWGPEVADETTQREAAASLVAAARSLAALESRTGRCIHLDLEPEPGCLLQRSGDVVDFYTRLLGHGADEAVRRHVRVCHDVCHAAVMFDGQDEAIGRYDRAGIRIGKVQVSAAVRARFTGRPAAERRQLLAELRSFHEPRYLHQTVAVDDGAERFFEDLPEALAWAEDHDGALEGEWRVHFHVPIFLDRLGVADSTASEIGRCLQALAGRPDVRHYEVETYAWTVLPEPLRTGRLADCIARELAWLQGLAGPEFFA